MSNIKEKTYPSDPSAIKKFVELLPIPAVVRPNKPYDRTTPGEVTTITMHFKDHTGDYVWHCHILEHDDHDIVRPLKVIEKSK